MADLDDFFAKKDKKKSKAKPKFLTAEELVKKLEREAAVAAAANKEKKKQEATNSALTSAATITPASAAATEEIVVEKPPVEEAPEEEWDDFEQEQRKDYTGLKIGQLTINDDEDESTGEGEEDEGDSEENVNAETTTSKRSGGGPWKKVIPAEEVTQIPMEIEKPSSKLYISPALRAAQAAAAAGPGPRIKARNRAAPDITNAEYFPSLSAARPEEQRKKKNEPAFEEVRHGGRVQRIHEPVAAPVSMANRFQTLDEDDS